MKSQIPRSLLVFMAFSACFVRAEGTTAFPAMGGVGDVAVRPGESLLGACSVSVKLTARGLHLRENAALGQLAMPDYPESLLAAGITGEAEVTFELKEDGSIARARVARAANLEFGVSSLAAVSRWKPKPLKWIGPPESIQVTATFVFSIFYE